ncbi:CcdC family protein [Alicyclobacillus sp. SO9]|uniref:CcdC family protein n=1 Tax=Alicyclobacillus sp. SO9 TaxID=2665646 RepID=UPI0018E6F1E0|nr:cytochrome c biogenesis protein CcdC [Alicyclobacillus sp. SO9]QQE77619.1 cytochrome c biogenesis protein CcdC [Alicyclobacillus sp. SO9]
MSNSMAELLATIVTIIGALTIIVVRMRGSGKPTNARKILIPPLGMSTGFLMFLAPITRDPVQYAIIAFLVGVFFSGPLIATSKMYVENGEVCMKRSKAFIFILLGLLVIRMVLHQYIEQYMTLEQTGSLFFILAFGMILPWRVAMFAQYQKLARNVVGNSSNRQLEEM